MNYEEYRAGSHQDLINKLKHYLIGIQFTEKSAVAVNYLRTSSSCQRCKS